MPLNIDLWFVLSPRQRAVCWLLSVFCGLLLMWWLAISPLNTAQERLVNQQREQQVALQMQWRKLRTLFTPPQGLPLSESQDFSPLGFQAPDRQLIRWQPGQDGGELVLETRWSSVAETFALLAGVGMQVPAFSLVADAGLLRFTLRLERDDDR